MPEHVKPLRCTIRGIGAWGPGFSNWQELRDCLCGLRKPDASQGAGPKPQIIPANERRRAPLPVRLAVETSWQATQHAELDPENLTCVFSSGFGDIDITDYMCSTLNSDTKLLSPTKFHNSVHNAPAGYWTMSSGCMQSATSVAGFKESTSVTLLEAIVQAISKDQSILLTFCDAPAKGPLIPVLINTYPFSASLIISPVVKTREIDSADTVVEMKVLYEEHEWPEMETHAFQSVYQENPSARILCLLEALAQNNRQSKVINMPLSRKTSLSLELQS